MREPQFRKLVGLVRLCGGCPARSAMAAIEHGRPVQINGREFTGPVELIQEANRVDDRLALGMSG